MPAEADHSPDSGSFGGGATPPPNSWWHCLIRDEKAVASRLVIVQSTLHPDDARIEAGAEDAAAWIGDDAVATAVLGTHGRVDALVVSERVAPGAPPLWFAELQESAARPPAVNLLAFSSGIQPAGRLLDRAALAQLPVVSADQVAALRWYPGTGEVDQVYVQPAWRRRGVSAALIMAAKALCAARDWSRLWGDGQRTALGERMRSTAWWRGRTAELTHLAPPMTPPAPTDSDEPAG